MKTLRGREVRAAIRVWDPIPADLRVLRGCLCEHQVRHVRVQGISEVQLGFNRGMEHDEGDLKGVPTSRDMEDAPTVGCRFMTGQGQGGHDQGNDSTWPGVEDDASQMY